MGGQIERRVAQLGQLHSTGLAFVHQVAALGPRWCSLVKLHSTARLSAPKAAAVPQAARHLAQEPIGNSACGQRHCFRFLLPFWGFV